MALLLKKLWSRLELPENDWVLSRFGSFETRFDTPQTGSPQTLEGEAPGESQRPASVSARLFARWFDRGLA